jgi:hypothetical protein
MEMNDDDDEGDRKKKKKMIGMEKKSVHTLDTQLNYIRGRKKKAGNKIEKR